MKAPKADDLIRIELRQCNKRLGDYLKSDVLLLKSPIKFGLDDVIRSEIENLPDSAKARANNLAVVIETTGGYIEVVERIYNVFRNHYSSVSYIVPNYAYSAGTVLVLSVL